MHYIMSFPIHRLKQMLAFLNLQVGNRDEMIKKVSDVVTDLIIDTSADVLSLINEEEY